MTIEAEPELTFAEARAALTLAEEAADKAIRDARTTLIVVALKGTLGNRTAAAATLGRSYRQLCRDIHTLGIGARLVDLERRYGWPAWGSGPLGRLALARRGAKT